MRRLRHIAPLGALFTLFTLLALLGTLLSTTSAAHAAVGGYPYCAQGSATDPDGDGWGWENGTSCVVRGSRADTVAPNGYPYCAQGPATDPDGDGWGWEDNGSCVVRYGSADQAGGGGGGTAACPAGLRCGSYAVGGLGARKGQLRAAGATSLDLAIAMLETERMSTDYVYGDGKTADAANFGVFKQNWLMLRSGCARFAGQGAGQWNNGQVLNTDLGADLACLHQDQAHYGLATWFAGHRNGASGLGDPNTQDIADYRNAVYWIQSQLDADTANLGNDTRFWVEVSPI